MAGHHRPLKELEFRMRARQKRGGLAEILENAKEMSITETASIERHAFYALLQCNRL